MPDSITSYVVQGVSMNQNDGMGLTVTEPKIQVFLPFFISMEFPYSIKRGEILIQTLVIHNYLDEDQHIDVSISKDLRFTMLDLTRYKWRGKSMNFYPAVLFT